MSKWFKAFQIGLQILEAVSEITTGQPASFAFAWKGKIYSIVVNQSAA